MAEHNTCYVCQKIKPGRGIMGRWVCYTCKPQPTGSPRYVRCVRDGLPIIAEKRGA